MYLIFLLRKMSIYDIVYYDIIIGGKYMRNKRFNGFMFHTKEVLNYDKRKYEYYNTAQNPTNDIIIVFKTYCVNERTIMYFYANDFEIGQFKEMGFKKISFKSDLIKKLVKSKIGDRFKICEDEYIFKGKIYYEPVYKDFL